MYLNSVSTGADFQKYLSLFGVRLGLIFMVRCTGPMNSGVGLHSSGRGLFESLQPWARV
jgi:hypothetical protein